MHHFSPAYIVGNWEDISYYFSEIAPESGSCGAGIKK
jgi:hypothetical protein